MRTKADSVPSTQRGQTPEPVTPRARADATAELGGEGGSYGDLTQSERTRRESDAAGRGQATSRIVVTALAVLIVIAAIVAMTFWAVGA
jgi:hypothetical protein